MLHDLVETVLSGLLSGGEQSTTGAEEDPDGAVQRSARPDGRRWCKGLETLSTTGRLPGRDRPPPGGRPALVLHVSSMRLLRVRYYAGDDLVSTDETPRVVLPAEAP